MASLLVDSYGQSPKSLPYLRQSETLWPNESKWRLTSTGWHLVNVHLHRWHCRNQPQTGPLRVVTSDIASSEDRLEQFGRRGVLIHKLIAHGLRDDERVIVSGQYSVGK